jgi:hypothetical protein
MIGHKRRRDGMVITRTYDDEAPGCWFILGGLIIGFILIAFLVKSMKS